MSPFCFLFLLNSWPSPTIWLTLSLTLLRHTASTVLLSFKDFSFYHRFFVSAYSCATMIAVHLYIFIFESRCCLTTAFVVRETVKQRQMASLLCAHCLLEKQAFQTRKPGSTTCTPLVCSTWVRTHLFLFSFLQIL